MFYNSKYFQEMFQIFIRYNKLMFRVINDERIPHKGKVMELKFIAIEFQTLLEEKYRLRLDNELFCSEEKSYTVQLIEKVQCCIDVEYGLN